MANTIRIKRRSAAGAAGAPTILAPAELAYNENDNTLYYGFGDGGSGNSSSVISVAGSGAFMTTGTTQTISVAKTFSNITISGGSISGITDLAIADGGTGSSTASGARANLSAAVLGANSDITSLTGLTTALSIAQGGTGSTTAAAALTSLGAYPATNPANYSSTVGTVTSVGINMPNQSIMTVGFSPVTTSGNIMLGFNSQPMNTMLMGPSSGANATPSFRTLTAADVPALSYLSTSGGTVSGNVVVTGSLEVQGSITTISSTTLTVSDKNIELATGSTTDAGANNGGITLKGLTDKLFTWISTTSSWTSSENLDLASGKVLKINGTTVLSATALDGVVVDGGTF